MMKNLFRAFLPALVFAVGCGSPPSASTTVPSTSPVKSEVALTVVSADELDTAIQSHKGKVVLVDAWFLGCAPCVKKFPHLVELHKAHAAEGLVCMSANVMGRSELESQDKVVAFLTKQRASFPNYILKDEKNDTDWMDRHKIEGTPALLLYDRAGKQVTISDDMDQELVDRLVQQTLDAK